MTPSIPANYVSILQLRERWQKRKEQEVGDEEERRRNQHAEEQQTIRDDLKKPRDDLDEMRLNQSDQKHCGRKSKKDESNDGGEASWAEEEEEETAAIRSEKGGDDGLTEKKKKRRHRKRYDSKKKRQNQEVDECGSIKPPDYTMTENNTRVKDQIRVYRKKEEKAMENKSIEKAVTAIETKFQDLSIKRGQETKKLKAQTRSLNRNSTETAAMVWVKKGINERAGDGNGSSVKPLNA